MTESEPTPEVAPAILENAVAYEKFKEEIPVVFINGKKAFKYHLDEEEFLKRLRRAR